MCGGKAVLDVACGMGFGGAMLLTEGARDVVGVDTDASALEWARFRGPAAQALVRADATSLPFRDESFDVITSFETIEHLNDDRAFLDEAARLLSPGGLLVLSTPNALYTQPVDRVPANPFHVREYLPDELLHLLRSRFSEVELRVQRTAQEWGPSFYWDKPEWLESSALWKLRRLVWRVRRRIQSTAVASLGVAQSRRPLYPSEFDFEFIDDDLARGHALVAVCSR